MKNLKNFENEDLYNNSSLEYPTVSYINDNGTVIIMCKEVNIITARIGMGVIDNYDDNGDDNGDGFVTCSLWGDGFDISQLSSISINGIDYDFINGFNYYSFDTSIDNIVVYTFKDGLSSVSMDNMFYRSEYEKEANIDGKDVIVKDYYYSRYSEIDFTMFSLPIVSSENMFYYGYKIKLNFSNYNPNNLVLSKTNFYNFSCDFIISCDYMDEWDNLLGSYNNNGYGRVIIYDSVDGCDISNFAFSAEHLYGLFYKFDKGMTWEEFIDSDYNFNVYNEYKAFKKGDDGYVYMIYITIYGTVGADVNYTSSSILLTDKVEHKFLNM